jgi:uncharacterized membrane protein YgcG
MAEDESSSAAAIEQIILTISETFVYKLPTLTSSSGYWAKDWDLANPLFTGCMKVFQQDNVLKLKLFTYRDPECRSTADDNINFFGECPIEVKPKEDVSRFVDCVIDSSRYFAIRIQEPNSTRSLLIGIGFRERDSALDFKGALNDYVRYIDRMHLAEKMHDEAQVETSASVDDDDGEGAAPVMHLKDMSLKQGEKIKIKLKGSSNETAKSRDRTSSGSSSGGGGGSGLKLLRPPPSGAAPRALSPMHSTKSDSTDTNAPAGSPATVFTKIENDVTPVASLGGLAQPAQAADEEEDWGDFEAA